MIRCAALSLALSLALAALAQAGEVAVPSGTRVLLMEVLRDDTPGELWLRFRYLAPSIGAGAGHITFDVAAIDIDHLCQEEAAPYVANHDLDPARIVVSMSDRALDFGVSDPEATQFFGAYRLEAGRCVWEEF